MMNEEQRCSYDGCKAIASWFRESWFSENKPVPVCEEHVKFYQLHGIKCWRIDAQDQLPPHEYLEKYRNYEFE